jgi:hypothetical protein
MVNEIKNWWINWNILIHQTPSTVFTTLITYTFDDQNRPATITRTGDGFTEVYTYTYYED